MRNHPFGHLYDRGACRARHLSHVVLVLHDFQEYHQDMTFRQWLSDFSEKKFRYEGSDRVEWFGHPFYWSAMISLFVSIWFLEGQGSWPLFLLMWLVLWVSWMLVVRQVEKRTDWLD